MVRRTGVSPQDALRRSQKSGVRRYGIFARNGENVAGFAQGEGKIRVVFEAFLNGFERFFAKIDEF